MSGRETLAENRKRTATLPVILFTAAVGTDKLTARRVRSLYPKAIRLQSLVWHGGGNAFGNRRAMKLEAVKLGAVEVSWLPVTSLWKSWLCRPLLRKHGCQRCRDCVRWFRPTFSIELRSHVVASSVLLLKSKHWIRVSESVIAAFSPLLQLYVEFRKLQ